MLFMVMVMLPVARKAMQAEGPGGGVGDATGGR